MVDSPISFDKNGVENLSDEAQIHNEGKSLSLVKVQMAGSNYSWRAVTA